ncbi:hypothetical protein B296_00036368, partial [Ensete ventricosum]
MPPSSSHPIAADDTDDGGGGEGSEEEGEEREGGVPNEVGVDVMPTDGDDVAPEGEGVDTVKIVDEAAVEAAIAEVGGKVGGSGSADAGVPEDLAVSGTGWRERGCWGNGGGRCQGQGRRSGRKGGNVSGVWRFVRVGGGQGRRQWR